MIKRIAYIINNNQKKIKKLITIDDEVFIANI